MLSLINLLCLLTELIFLVGSNGRLESSHEVNTFVTKNEQTAIYPQDVMSSAVIFCDIFTFKFPQISQILLTPNFNALLNSY